MGRVGGREIQEGRDMGTYCICVANSLCYRAEANTPLWGNYTSIKMFKKKKNFIHRCDNLGENMHYRIVYRGKKELTYKLIDEIVQ